VSREGDSRLCLDGLCSTMDDSAAKVQAIVRGRRARTDALRQDNDGAATKVQAIYRGARARKRQRKPKKTGDASTAKTWRRASTGYRVKSSQVTVPVALDDHQYTVNLWPDLETFRVTWKSQNGPLPDGECNLYAYPKVAFHADDNQVCLADANLRELEGHEENIDRLMFAALLASTPGSASKWQPVLEVRNAVQATAYHALFMANTPPAISLAYRVVCSRPEVLPTRFTGGPYAGENCLHILAVNRRQDTILQLLSLAKSQLDETRQKELLYAAASGKFFTKVPMRHYGGSPVAFAACFDLSEAVKEMVLGFSFVDLNDPDLACPISGYLPLHAVVATGNADMYNFLTSLDVFGADRAADQNAPTVTRSSGGSGKPLPGQTTLQLAVHLGQKKMFEQILAKKAVMLWTWGPASEYSVDLLGIDTSGVPVDLLGIVTSVRASQATREMLLDTCMDGMLHKLFERKWASWARYVHYLLRLLDLSYLLLVLLLGFGVKEGDVNRSVLPPLTFFFGLAELLVELHCLYCFVREAAAYGGDTGLRSFVMRGLEMVSHRKFGGVLCVWLACLLVALSADYDLPACALLAFGSFAQFNQTIEKVFVPYKQMSVFALSVGIVLMSDGIIFLVFLVCYLAAFWTALYIAYPHLPSYDELDVPIVEDFERWDTSLQSMIEMGFTVSKFSLDLTEASKLDDAQVVNLAVYILFYIYSIILLSILLLRFLMAMLTAKFNQVKTRSDLEWRCLFGQHILRYECLWPSSLLWPTEGGEFVKRVDGERDRFVYRWTEIKAAAAVGPPGGTATKLGGDRRSNKVAPA